MVESSAIAKRDRRTKISHKERVKRGERASGERRKVYAVELGLEVLLGLGQDTKLLEHHLLLLLFYTIFKDTSGFIL